ncbi:PREDICTED: aminoacylase-1-like [Ceratosolen solmsi marchali]|uniref:N-acyl-aliphatic-L-amino acid amidohydrolase n=1 Tax=Ceratosolen solmsi marchali TaxID=326594 RepID=A0AAJ6VL74_9HYME|nr:PREDICTED: aminoacylase-1-like [Ceratosolen solmsi marchali]
MARPTAAQLDATAVDNFREYLKIASVHPNIDYGDCEKFLKKCANSLELPITVYYMSGGSTCKNPIIVITWIGTDSSLPSICLNSHMDVVPVFPEYWTHDPFGAEMDDKGNIYARGSQDMKCVGIQYLEAIRRMKLNGQKLKRTIHITFVPEEEVGGINGMRDFVKTNDFKNLNIGFTLDEGVTSPTNNYYLFHGERSIWQIEVHCPGNAGHASLLLDNTPGEKLRVIIDKFMDFRAEQKAKLSNPNKQIGDVTSVNLTQIAGGVQNNVIPSSLFVVFDIRIDTNTDHKTFEDMLNKWCEEAGEGIYIKFIQKEKFVEVTKLDETNPFWLAMKKSCDKQNINLEIGIFPGGTDSRFIRDLGIPAIGFSPINNTKILLHDHDEYLNKDVFLRGIEIYMDIIASVASV